MAYGNWGAFVYKNGERQKNREDNTPYSEDELRPGYYQAFGGNDEKGNRFSTGKKLSCMHASLGSGTVRLCGYKNSPVLYVEGETVNLEPYIVDSTDEWEHLYRGEIAGHTFEANQYDGNMIDLKLLEPDGTVWTGKCGYLYGAGHMDDPA